MVSVVQITKGALLALCLSAGAGWAGSDRLAMVIGNSAYSGVPSLINPKNDATQLAAKLQSFGFDVQLLTDLPEDGLWAALDQLTAKAKDAEIVLFYFSGHGFQLEGANYLVPVDARLSSSDAIAQETWVLSDILQRLEAAGTNTVVMLDACRNNPLPPSMQPPSGGLGLARIESGADTKVVFATQPNAVAYEGTGELSFFTEALIDHMGVANQSLDDLIREVRNQVRDETARRQVPWSGGNLADAFYFKTKPEGRDGLWDSDLENLLLNYNLDPASRLEMISDLAATLGFDRAQVLSRLAELETEMGRSAPTEATPTESVTLAALDPSGAEIDDQGRLRPDRVSARAVGRVRAAVPVTRAVLPDIAVPVDTVSLRIAGTLLGGGATPTEPAVPNDDVLLQDLGVLPDLSDPDLKRAAQTELHRLGCYNDRIDGIWGKNSKYALLSYRLAKGQTVGDLGADQGLLLALRAEPAVICSGKVSQRSTRVAAVVPPPVQTPVRAPSKVIAPAVQDEIKSGNTFIGIRLR